MDVIQYAELNEEFIFAQAIPDSQFEDSIKVTIQRLSDEKYWNFATEAFQVASYEGDMTFISGTWWKQAFTPDLAGQYLVTITLGDVAYYQTIIVRGVTPAGSVGDNLTTRDNVKDYMNIQDNNSDNIINDLIARVSKAIAKLCDRDFAVTTYTEYQSSDGEEELLTKQYPINSVTSVYDDPDRLYSAETLIPSDEYCFEDPNLLRFDTPLSKNGKKNIKIVYNAGYATIPQDLEMAAIYMVVAEYKRSRTEVNTPEGQTAKTESIKDLETKAEKLLLPYKRFA